MLVKIRKALISVSDKRGLIELARELTRFHVEIISTGGTYRALREADIEVRQVSDVTGFPEMMEGRVKTLHPKIHAGILADRRNPRHTEDLKREGIAPIDLVVVNLYPFAQTVAREEVTLEEAIENIDIGGPTMIRAAAKNFLCVAVLVDPERYPSFIQEMKANEGAISEETRRQLAQEAFAYTARYDQKIYTYLSPDEDGFSDKIFLSYDKLLDLRYGENPHQKASYYRDPDAAEGTLVRAEKLHGKPLSFNNILDLDAAWKLAQEFSLPTVVIVKHNNPCGVAEATTVADAYQKAYACDPLSAFGGVVACNTLVDLKVAKMINKTFIEAIIAPGYRSEALRELRKKEQIRVLEMGSKRERGLRSRELKFVDGGLLIQDADVGMEAFENMEVVTKAKPSAKEMEDLLFALRVAKHVRSNAIVLAEGLKTVGIGAGQMSRVDATKIAVMKAGDRSKGSVLASDAFFPFRDSVDWAAQHGIRAIIQPGGSVRDEEVIAAADEHGIAMVLTGRRHFRH